MAIIRSKTKKKITKQVKKLVKKHGSEVALGAATALVTTIINQATAGPAKKKEKGKKAVPKEKKSPKAGDSEGGEQGKKAGTKSKKKES